MIYVYITDITTTSPQPNEVEIPSSIRKLSVKKVHFKEVCYIIIIIYSYIIKLDL